MRRLMILLAGACLLPAAIGCYFIAGQCDCDPGCDKCSMYGVGPDHLGSMPAGGIEHSQAMPRVAE